MIITIIGIGINYLKLYLRKNDKNCNKEEVKNKEEEDDWIFLKYFFICFIAELRWMNSITQTKKVVDVKNWNNFLANNVISIYFIYLFLMKRIFFNIFFKDRHDEFKN